MISDEILVSICCITYNQESYIKDALEGFLKQKTNFSYEIIIHDDASTDNTTNIIKAYEKKYPDIIKTICEEKNQYSLGKWCLVKTFNEAKGKYITVCEGDDYWIDENKLQEQVDYMEKHKECTFCFHNANVLDMRSNTIKGKLVPTSNELDKYLKPDNIYNVGELELLGFLPTASFMFRTENVAKLPNWFEECFVQDWPLKLIMTSFGYGYFINKPMSIYRKNAKGSVTNDNLKTSRDSSSGKIHILNKETEIVNWIDEFTEGQYKEIFDLRRKERKIETLIAERKNKEIIKNKYLKGFSIKTKVKYLLKMYCKPLIRIYKKMRNI